MEKLYLGVDLHKRSCLVTVLDADGHLLESRGLGRRSRNSWSSSGRCESRRPWRWKRRSTGITF